VCVLFPPSSRTGIFHSTSRQTGGIIIINKKLGKKNKIYTAGQVATTAGDIDNEKPPIIAAGETVYLLN